MNTSRIGYDIEQILAINESPENKNYTLYNILTQFINEEDLCEFETQYYHLQEFRSRFLENGICRYFDEDDFHELEAGLRGLSAVDSQLSISIRDSIVTELTNIGVMSSNETHLSYPKGDEDEIDMLASNIDSKLSPLLESTELESHIYDHIVRNKKLLQDLKHCSRIVSQNDEGKWSIQENLLS